MGALLQDIRYALRQLRKTPGFTLTAVLTLALGIGANAAIFTLVNALLMKDLPVVEPKTLIRIGDQNDCCVGNGVDPSGDVTLFSTDTYQQFKKNTPEFAELAAIQAGFEYRPIIARRDGADTLAKSVSGEFVSGNYFRTFGLKAAAGRLTTDADDVQGAPMTAVMSYDTWKREFNGDASVVGSTFWINTKPVTIIGIAPEGFFGDRMAGTPPEYFLPIETMPVLANAPYVHSPEENWLYLVGRVKPGVSLPALQDKLSAQLRQIQSTNSNYAGTQGKALLAKTHVVLTQGGAGITQMQNQYAEQLHLLMWISGLVLLIACANIANLLLVRGMARKAEMSVRSALGAKRSRIVQQLLTESIVLSGLSCIVGLIVAYGGTKMLLAMAFPYSQSVTIHASPSPEVIGFAFALSLITGILFGVAPAYMAAKAEPADALRSGTRTTASGATLLQRGLVVTQAALSLVLLVGAGLFMQSLNKLQNMDMHLDATNRYIIHMNPQAAGYSQTQLEGLYREMEDRFHAIPGVVKVGISSYTPMEDNNNGYSVQIQGQPVLHINNVSRIHANAEYFDSVGTKVVMGRGITAQDTSSSPTVAVVNQAFVKKFFKPGENPIGRRFGSAGNKSTDDWEIVGVVEDTAYQDVRWTDHLMSFIPLMQRQPSDTSPIQKDDSLYAGAIVVETSRPMNDMESISRRTLAAINPNLTVVKFQTFSDQIYGNFTQERMLSRLMLLFAILALALASVGLYGVTAYGVARRTSEIGIRMALGAERSGVMLMVLRGVMIQSALGLAIGIPLSIACVKYVQAQLYNITSVDGVIMATGITTLIAAAALAGVIPARRAATINPMTALRTE